MQNNIILYVTFETHIHILQACDGNIKSMNENSSLEISHSDTVPRMFYMATRRKDDQPKNTPARKKYITLKDINVNGWDLLCCTFQV